MNSLYQHYIIDLSSNNNFVQIPTVQGDGNGIRGFEVELIENGVQYIIDENDCMIVIMGTKPDTNQIMNDCILTDEGYILVDITSQMSAVKGRGDYQIVLMSKSTNSQLKSFPFHILTTPAAFDIDYISSSDEFQVFTKNTVRAEAVIENANLAITDIRQLESNINAEESNRAAAEENRITSENIRKSNETIRLTNETDRISAENARNNAESIRSNAEDTRAANENIRIDNEKIRNTNETDRENAESIRINAETARVNAETVRKTNESMRLENESKRNISESDRLAEESKRDNAERIRIENESIRQTNESARQNNESNRQISAATAISNAEKAAERANTAAEACENITSGTGIVMQTEKGSANGVATLDANKKLTGSQLPIATTSVLGGVIIGSNVAIDNGTISVSKANVTNALGFIPIKQSDTTTELLSSTEPASNSQNMGDFWLQEYT